MIHPSYCCQKCGEPIGWIGRAFQWMGASRQMKLHRVECDGKPYIGFVPFMFVMLGMIMIIPLLVGGE